MHRKIDVAQRLRQQQLINPAGEWPILDPALTDDWDTELPLSQHDAFDDLTPATLLRDGDTERWLTRPGEDEDGLEDPDAVALSEAFELESPRRQLH